MKKIFLSSLILLPVFCLCSCGTQKADEGSTEDATTEKFIQVKRSSDSEAESETDLYTTIKSVFGVVFQVPNDILQAASIENPNLLNSDTFSYDAISDKNNYEFLSLDLSAPVLIKNSSEFLYINAEDSVYYVGEQEAGVTKSIYGISDDESLYDSISYFSNSGINRIDSIENATFDRSNSDIVSCMADIYFTDANGYSMSGVIKILENKYAQYYFIYGTLEDGEDFGSDGGEDSEENSVQGYDPDIESLADSFQLADETYDSSTIINDYEIKKYTFDYGGRKATIPLSTIFKIDPQNECYNLPGAYYQTSVSANEYFGVSVGYSYYKLPSSDIKPEDFLAWWSLPYLDYNMTKEEIKDQNGNTWIKTKSDQRFVTGNDFSGSYVCIYSLQRKKSAYVFTLIYEPSAIDYETLFETGLKSVELTKGESEKYTLNDDYVNYILYDLEQKQLFSYCQPADQKKYLTKLYNEINKDGTWDKYKNMTETTGDDSLEGEIIENNTSEGSTEATTEDIDVSSTEETTAQAIKLPDQKKKKKNK